MDRQRGPCTKGSIPLSMTPKGTRPFATAGRGHRTCTAAHRFPSQPHRALQSLKYHPECLRADRAVNCHLQKEVTTRNGKRDRAFLDTVAPATIHCCLGFTKRSASFLSPELSCPGMIKAGNHSMSLDLRRQACGPWPREKLDTSFVPLRVLTW